MTPTDAWSRRRPTSNHVRSFGLQETERPEPSPDMNPSRDDHLYDFEPEDRDFADHDGAPPFTGEDVEDAGHPEHSFARDCGAGVAFDVAGTDVQ